MPAQNGDETLKQKLSSEVLDQKLGARGYVAVTLSPEKEAKLSQVHIWTKDIVAVIYFEELNKVNYVDTIDALRGLGVQKVLFVFESFNYTMFSPSPTQAGLRLLSFVKKIVVATRKGNAPMVERFSNIVVSMVKGALSGGGIHYLDISEIDEAVETVES